MRSKPRRRCNDFTNEKRGWPLTLQDMEVHQYILHLHEINGLVNGAVVRVTVL